MNEEPDENRDPRMNPANEYVADRPAELRSYYPELDPYGRRLDPYDDSSGLVAGLLMLVLAFVLGIAVGVVGGWLIFG